jgi:hypothetical protein
MSGRILAVTTTLALGTGFAGLSYAAVRTAPPAQPASTSVSTTPSPRATPETCSSPTSDDPAGVVVVRGPVAVPATSPTATASREGRPAAVTSDDRKGRSATTAVARPARSPEAADDRGGNRGPGSVSADDSGRDDSGSDDSGRDSGGDDGTADQGHGDR